MIICPFLANSQSTFEFLFSRTVNEITRSLIEDNEGNLYFPVENFEYGLILKLNNQGQFVDSVHIDNPKGTCNIGELIALNDNYFIALGSWSADSTSELWYLKFDYDLQLVEDKKLYSEGWLIYDFKHIINHRNNLVFVALYAQQFFFDICIYEITLDGQLVRKVFFNPLILGNQAYSLLEDTFDLTYKVFTWFPLPTRPLSSFSILDSTFNIISQGGFHDSIFTHNTAKWLDDSTYLLTGKNSFYGSDEWNIGILKVTRNDHVLSTAYFGKDDTEEWPGIYKNLDFISPENIFYAGTSNSFWYPFQMEPSWIMINTLDSDLNLKTQHYYGGDAYYLVNAVLATQDSGCVMACSRYDHLTQFNEFDVYILKVNKDGLLVSVPDDPMISQSVCELYPNPGIDKLYIESELDGLNVRFFDVNGKLRLSAGIGPGKNLIGTAGLASGIYLYQIHNQKDKLIQSGKWLKL